jgi:hypothetical protein
MAEVRYVVTLPKGIVVLPNVLSISAFTRTTLTALCLSAAAQWVSANDAAPTGVAARFLTAPVIDGEVISDSAWGRPFATQFWQQRPQEGAPATQETEVFVGFTDDALYVAVIAYDTDPEGIIVSGQRRDDPLEDTDMFAFVIDSFRDGQNGFLFGTNPSGIETDGQITRDGGAGGPGISSFNMNWDTNWQVKTQTGDFGWSAEFEIPFKSLRYPADGVQSWGMNFRRSIRRNNETVFWAPIQRQHSLMRVTDAGVVSGFEPPRQRNLKVTPYALGKQNGGNMIESQSDQEFGVDVKYGVTPSLTLDLTYNTDFAQVEVDEFQANLDRFSLFLPEQRPFFLENAGQFAVGVAREVELFFSRRIGIGPDGSQIPIKGGARLSGKIGSSTNVGFLHMQAEEVAGVVAQTDFTVARVSQEFANRSSLGVIFVNREADELDQPGRSDYNRTYAVDGRWGIGADGQITGFVAKTDTPELKGDDTAFQLAGNYSSEAWSYSGGVTQVGKNFNPEVGFLRRRDYTKANVRVLHRIRNSSWKNMLELRPHVSYAGFWGGDGLHETGFLHIDNHWEWQSGFEVHTGVNFLHEGVRKDFELAPGKVVRAGDYDDEELQLVLMTDRGAPLSFSVRSHIGGFFGGERVQLRPTIRYRIGDAFNASLAWNYNQIKLAYEPKPFDLNIARLRLNYSFNPKVSLQALVQYNDSTDVMATNLRLAWLTSADAGFYLVYNETRDDDVGMFREKRNEWILKFSHTFDVF